MRIHFKKAASMMLSILMIAAMMVPAFAVDITIDGTGMSYSAYRLLDLTTNLKANHEAHDGAHTTNCYNFAYTVNDKYRAVLQDIAKGANKVGTVSDAEIIDYIEGQSTSEAIRTFADNVFAQVKSMDADATAANKVFSNIEQGYYLIAETQAAGNDAISLVMLDTAGQDDITIKSKEDVPTLTKTVQEVNDSTGATSWGTAADHDIGDDVMFKLIGTMPDNIDSYDTYKYIIHDTMSDNLAFKADSLKVEIDGAEIRSGYTVETSNEDGCSLHIIFDNIKAIGGVSKSSQVVVTYSATLTTGAPLRNTNKAALEFSNDPYTVGNTSTTPDSTVAVYDYTLTINKVDEQNTSLVGAQFKLMKWDNASGDYVDYANGTQTNSEGATSFTFFGLDEGKYKLVEAVVPDGYTKAEDIEFTITSTVTVDNVTALAVDNTSVTVTSSNGTLVTTVQNIPGTLLPTTGGIGVYIVYGVGAILVIGALAFVITRKKKESAKKD